MKLQSGGPLSSVLVLVAVFYCIYGWTETSEQDNSVIFACHVIQTFRLEWAQF